MIKITGPVKNIRWEITVLDEDRILARFEFEHEKVARIFYYELERKVFYIFSRHYGFEKLE